ncbi:MAG: hypothetical protein CML46_02010 [Rhodobacteraceae bacterium]|nr:hypothetical protein [Paracoccaceae bacterium]MBR25712.1 hypothetical protein [Paracoccaceae bacterium]
MSGLILTGLYDSPFVRRAALALTFHGIEFEHRALSVFGDFDEVLKVNPLGRAPSLEMEDGRVLVDSRAIIEWVEAWADPERRRLTPREQEDLLVTLKIESVAIGLAELAVSRSLEARREPQYQDPARFARLDRQIGSALSWLEERARVIRTQGMPAHGLSRAGIASVCAVTYLRHRWPDLLDAAGCENLVALTAELEQTEPFTLVPFPAG